MSLWHWLFGMWVADRILGGDSSADDECDYCDEYDQIGEWDDLDDLDQDDYDDEY
ncbi:MAG: hypothetical protein J6P90_08715 [Rikenellaceae bacterium]|nr:hypothetical protein [Rikenellaceae bacterium]